jgi:ABC-type antimicrobial peptide transport system permease subunit
VDVGLAAALAYAAIALSAALALSGSARAPETAHLRTLGLTPRDSVWLTIVEHGPTVVLAVAFGIVLGTATFGALRPGLGLGAIVGSDLDIPLQIGLAQLGPLVLAIVAIVAIGIGLGAIVEREPAAPTALRRGI